MNRALTAKRILGEAYRLLIVRRRTLARLVAIPFSLLVVFNLLLRQAMDDWLYVIAQIPVTLVLQTIVAVAIHRLVLIGDGSVFTWGFGRWTRRESTYALYLFLAGLLVSSSMLLGIVPFVGEWLALGAALWLISRIALLFPAIAIDHEMSLRGAWQLSRQHQWQILLVLGASVGAFILALIVLFGPLILTIVMEASQVVVVMLILLSVAVSLVLYGGFVIFTVVALSLAYREVILVATGAAGMEKDDKESERDGRD